MHLDLSALMGTAEQFLDVTDQPMGSVSGLAPRAYLDVEEGAKEQSMGSMSGSASHARSRWTALGTVAALLLTAPLVFVFGGKAQALPEGILRPKPAASDRELPIDLAFAPSVMVIPAPFTGSGAAYDTNSGRSPVMYRPQTSRRSSSVVSGLPDAAAAQDAFQPLKKSLDTFDAGTQRTDKSAESLTESVDVLDNGLQKSDKALETLVQQSVETSHVGTQTVKKSSEVVAAEAEAWSLLAAADQAGRSRKRQRLIASLAFSVGAAVVFGNAEAMAAGLPTTALSQEVDAVAVASLGASVDWETILKTAKDKALGTGKASVLSAVAQVLSLMWLRTSMNYQYRYGGNLSSTLTKLYKEGGIPRLYRGLPFALIQAPLIRFGTIAANVGMLALLDSVPLSAGLPLPIKVAAASITSALWRIVCMPVDTAKIALNVEGKPGFHKLTKRVMKEGPGVLYQGSFATVASTFAGMYPWWLTYSFVDGILPTFSPDQMLFSLMRAAFVGLSASAVSDAVSNGFKVIKTTQQIAWLGANDTNPDPVKGTKGDRISQTGMSIAEALKLVLEQDGVKGLMTRGLGTKFLLNAIQGTMFTVLWKYFQLTRAVA